MLASIGRPTGFTPPYAAALDHGGPALVLQNLSDRGPLDRRERVRASIGIGKLFLQMSVRNAPISSPLLIAMLLPIVMRSEEHTSELQSLMRISYAVFCLKKKTLT